MWILQVNCTTARRKKAKHLRECKKSNAREATNSCPLNTETVMTSVDIQKMTLCTL